MTPTEVYLDHAASAPLRPEAREALLAALDLGPGNASSAHAAGRRLRRALEDAREQVAALVGRDPAEVVFTSGTSESNRIAVRGVLAATSAGRVGVVRTGADHASLAEAVEASATRVRIVPASAAGEVQAAGLLRLVEDETALVAMPLVQSVTGARLPAEAVLAGLGDRDVPLLLDAAQAVGREPMGGIPADLIAFSAHKLGGPHGIGALVVRAGLPFRSGTATTSQERGRRGGTEAVALAAAFGAAATAAAAEIEHADAHARRVMAPLLDYVRATTGARLLSPSDGAPHIALIAFDGCPGDALLAALDARGIRVSVGSACASRARTPPRVLLDAGVVPERAREACRISVGTTTNSSDVATLVRAFADVVPRIRDAFTRGVRGLEKSSQENSRDDSTSSA